MAINAIFSVPKSSNEFICEICDYKTSRLSQYNRHILTAKHLMLCKMLYNEPEWNQKVPNYKCCNCKKQFKHQPSLSRHKKTCIKKEEKENNELVVVQKPTINHEMVFDFVKQMTENNELLIKHQIEKEAQNSKNNQEFQMQMFQQMMEFMKQQCATTNNIVNGNVNNNYTQFNLQVYLNETCKNAMTVNQFLDYLQPTVEELEATAHLGYVEGISRIIMRGFKNLEEHELPFHCSDLKREHIYVKNPDEEWVEEKDEKPLLLLFIKEVARKNFNNISAWQKKNPNWSNYHSKQNDMFMKILNNSVSGATEEEQQANYEKIMKNIMKNTVIDKSKKNSK